MEIIGGGPAGLFSAYNLAKGGEKVTLYEEHPQIGHPNHCAGLISSRLLEMIPKEDYIVQRVDKAKIFYGKKSFSLEREGVAWVVDRPKLDKFLAELALSKGAEIHLRKKADPFKLKKPLIDASGTGSILRHRMEQRLKLLPARQYVIKKRIEDVEVHFTPLAPEFFAWAIPAGENTRVGMAARNLNLDLFVRRNFPPSKIVEKSAGTVVVGGPVKRTEFDGRLLVGDSAGQVKATTGGGVVMGMKAAECAASAILEDDPSSYPERWRKKIGGELETARRIRWLMDRVKKKHFFDLCHLNQELLQEKGDMDFHTEVAKEILLKPSNWPSLLKLIFSFFV